NNLAWIFATHPSAEYRDGAEAVKLAEAARARVGDRNAQLLDTLAAAYAETGAFDMAVQTAETAFKLVQNGDSNYAAQLSRRIALYREHKPFRDTDASRATTIPSVHAP